MLRIIHSDEGLTTKDPDIPSVFLAGPSPRGRGAGFPDDWRDEAFQYFQNDYLFNKIDGQLFVPRPTIGNAPSYDGQIEWELHHLSMADVIMFWVPRKAPDMMGLTTNVEFGFTVKTGRIVYGRPDGALQTRYLDHLYKKFKGKDPKTTLEETAQAAMTMAIANLI